MVFQKSIDILDHLIEHFNSKIKWLNCPLKAGFTSRISFDWSPQVITQFWSALLLIGLNVETMYDCICVKQKESYWIAVEKTNI